MAAIPSERRVRPTREGNGEGPVDRRTQGSRTRQAIHDAAVTSFAVHGYAGTSLRSLAAEVGVEVGSLYRHFASKEELLFAVTTQASDAFRQSLLETLAAAPPPPLDRLRAVTAEMARYHAVHGAQGLVGSVEVRELSRLHYKHAIKQRNAVETIFEELVDECIASGYFPAGTNPSVTANFVIAVATGIANWYDPSGPLTPDQVAAMATDFAVPDAASHDRRFGASPNTIPATRAFKR